MADATYQGKVHLSQGAKTLECESGSTQLFDVGSTLLYSVTDSLTALAGGGQTGATALTAQINRVTTVATIADSCLLPASQAGLSITVVNATSNSMNVFPATGDKINALSANAAFAVAGGKTAEFFCTAAGQWHTILSA